MQGAKKSYFLHFKHYNLVIYVVYFLENFSTHYFNSLGQNPIVESNQKRKKKKRFMQFALEVAILECSSKNHGEGNLGVNKVNVNRKIV